MNKALISFSPLLLVRSQAVAAVPLSQGLQAAEREAGEWRAGGVRRGREGRGRLGWKGREGQWSEEGGRRGCQALSTLRPAMPCQCPLPASFDRSLNSFPPLPASTQPSSLRPRSRSWRRPPPHASPRRRLRPRRPQQRRRQRQHQQQHWHQYQLQRQRQPSPPRPQRRPPRPGQQLQVRPSQPPRKDACTPLSHALPLAHFVSLSRPLPLTHPLPLSYTHILSLSLSHTHTLSRLLFSPRRRSRDLPRGSRDRRRAAPEPLPLDPRSHWQRRRRRGPSGGGGACAEPLTVHPGSQQHERQRGRLLHLRSDQIRGP